MSVVERFADAAVMFWQSLDDNERRMLVAGVAWVAVVLVTVPLERASKERDRDELAAAIAERLTVRHG